MKSNLALWLAFPDILFSAPIFSSAAFFLGFLTAWILALPFQTEVIPQEAFLCPNCLSFIWSPARGVGGGAGAEATTLQAALICPPSTCSDCFSSPRDRLPWGAEARAGLVPLMSAPGTSDIRFRGRREWYGLSRPECRPPKAPEFRGHKREGGVVS